MKLILALLLTFNIIGYTSYAAEDSSSRDDQTSQEQQKEQREKKEKMNEKFEAIQIKQMLKFISSKNAPK